MGAVSRMCDSGIFYLLASPQQLPLMISDPAQNEFSFFLMRAKTFAKKCASGNEMQATSNFCRNRENVPKTFFFS
jgi:hypothetical protein